MWQLWNQIRCPSYLQLHFMALLVKSLSATSWFGLITTWRGEKSRDGRTEKSSPVKDSARHFSSTCRATQAHLENVVSGFDVRHVDPLAVDVVTVQIPAAHSDALISEVGTLVSLRNTWEQKHSVTVAKCVSCVINTVICQHTMNEWMQHIYTQYNITLQCKNTSEIISKLISQLTYLASIKFSL